MKPCSISATFNPDLEGRPMATKMPFMRFFPSDHRSDPNLRLCSIAARGLWVELICLMHEAVPYGHLIVSGRAPTDADLAVLVGMPSDQLSDLIAELEAHDVFSRTKPGTIFSRRMVRDARNMVHARKNGKLGGNPSLTTPRKKRRKSPGVNPPLKPPDKAQMPDARCQTPDPPESGPDPQRSGPDSGDDLCESLRQRRERMLRPAPHPRDPDPSEQADGKHPSKT
jgi:hypothetical protein